PEDSYCDSCDYREVAIGIVRDVSTDGDHTGGDGPPDGKFADNNDAFYFFAQGPDGWESDMDTFQPDTNFITHPYEKSNFYYLTVATAALPVTTQSYPVPPQRIGAGAGSHYTRWSTAHPTWRARACSRPRSGPPRSKPRRPPKLASAFCVPAIHWKCKSIATPRSRQASCVVTWPRQQAWVGMPRR